MVGVSCIVREAVTSTLPTMFSALHLYSPSSTPVTRVILSTPPGRISVLAVRGLLSSLVQVISGLGIPATAGTGRGHCPRW